MARSWPIKKSKVQRMVVAKMRMIRYMYNHRRLDRIKNIVVKDKVGVGLIEDETREARLTWFGHLRRRSMDAPVRRCEKIQLMGRRRGRGGPRKSWSEVIRHDLLTLGLTEDMAMKI